MAQRPAPSAWICPHCLSEVGESNRVSWPTMLLAVLTAAGAGALHRGQWTLSSYLVGALAALFLLAALSTGRPYCGLCQANGLVPLSSPRGHLLRREALLALETLAAPSPDPESPHTRPEPPGPH